MWDCHSNREIVYAECPERLLLLMRSLIQSVRVEAKIRWYWGTKFFALRLTKLYNLVWLLSQQGSTGPATPTHSIQCSPAWLYRLWLTLQLGITFANSTSWSGSYNQLHLTCMCSCKRNSCWAQGEGDPLCGWRGTGIRPERSNSSSPRLLLS